MYFIIKGVVAVVSRDGESIYAELRAGTFFGEIGVLFTIPRTASVIAQTRCLLLALTAEALREQLPSYPKVERMILDTIDERLALLNKQKEASGWTRALHTHPIDVRGSIQQFPLFRDLPPKVLHFLALSVQPRTYPPFAPIIVQDTVPPGKEIYFILSGSVEIIDETTHTVKATLWRGQYFGELAWLDLSSRRTASVRAVSQTECLLLGGHVLEQVNQLYPAMTESITRTAQDRMRVEFPIDYQPGKPNVSFDLETASDPDPFLVSSDAPPKVRRPCSISIHITSDDPKEAVPSLKHALSAVHIVENAKRPRLDSSHLVRPTYTPTSAGPLSEAILVQIFSLLDLPELMRLRCISSFWNYLLTYSTSLLNTLDLKPVNRLINDKALKVIAPFANTRPQVVDMSNCYHITDEGFACFVPWVGPHVRIWNMKSVWDVSGSALLNLVNRMPNLEEIDLSNCRKIGDATLTRIVGWVVSSQPPVDATSLYSPGTVIGCSKLQRITLNYCKHVTDRSMHHIALHAAHRIKSINLTRCTTITDAGFQTWSFTRFPNLESLCLADCTFLTDSAIVFLTNAARGLRRLDLSFCCALSDTSLEVLSLGCPRLTHLTLSFCGSAVSDASLRAIGLHLLELGYLSVRGCVRVTGIGVESIVDGCQVLETFNVSQCRNLQAWIATKGPEKLVASGKKIKFIT